MTAEIAILNKEAVALAADSAVTAGFQTNQKIFSSANKLFALSKFAPVGMMIYGGAQFMNIPWETIIKEFRRKLDEERFAKLSEYADSFIEFLDGGNDFVPPKVQDHYFKEHVTSYFHSLLKAINDKIEELLIEKNEINHEEVEHIVSYLIKTIHDRWQQSEDIPSLPKNFAKQLRQRYHKDVIKIKKDIFQNLPVKKANSKKLHDMAYYLFSKPLAHGLSRKATSGIVIAGFGEKDIFPSLRVFHIDGFVNKRLIYNEMDTGSGIDFEQSALIVPFAQQEMVATFMEGINPDYQKLIYNSLFDAIIQYTQTILDKIKNPISKKSKDELKNKLFNASTKLIKSLISQWNDHKKTEFSNPVVEVVSTLPKDELASMAESLVHLTSLKRRVSLDLETVGGPIDVAVISKSDGFVWIRRKRYFEKDINPRFFASYNKR